MTTTHTTPQPTSITDLEGREGLEWNFRDQLEPGEYWNKCSAWVHETFPEAKHSGMGYWKIPRKAEIFYFAGTIRYIPRNGQPPRRSFSPPIVKTRKPA